MMNFCIITLLLLATRKLLWVINSTTMEYAENKIKKFFSAVANLFVFIVDISLATNTEQAMYLNYRKNATENRNRKIKETVQNQSQFLLTLLEPVAQNDVAESEANSKVA